MTHILKPIWFKLQVWYGARCSCGGTMREVHGWPKLKCDQCGRTAKS